MKLEFETDAGIGTRATLGVIVLETDETLEPEFSKVMALDGVALYHSRIPMVPEIRADTLAKMEKDLPASARLLPPSLNFDVIGYGCTSASTVIGSENVARAIQTVFPGALVTDPLAAVIAAAREINAKRLGFITPYVPEVSERMQQRLTEVGFEIAAFGSFEEGNDQTVARISETSIIRAAERVAATAPCDAIVISCTNLRTLNILMEMEKRIGVPIISSNQALAWHMLRLAKIKDHRPEFGHLFS
ncbi:MAG: aspartate/glutamate racemase family protein [Roseibium sp.]|uniref:maleate cis-trans isomerase family protein n=1 Tax=Roseibium sp. TaxID=1936156 RepID=UPI00262C6472|nr:aspartate/glutamate racemase family protein [Roseibium sp.]MCV0428016.1 aspartate/glutamate racemase family protein [Roseibium sp.]